MKHDDLRVTLLTQSAIMMAVLGLLCGPTHSADFDKLLLRIPESANAIVALDAAAVFESALAKKEGWKESYADSFAASPILVPPNAKHFLLASELHIENMRPEWEVAATDLSVDPSIDDIAKRFGGVVDTFSGVQALWTIPQHCLVKFGPHEFGIIFPATRHKAASWAGRASKQDRIVASPYLRSAVGYAGGAGPEIIMAIDLADIIRPEEMRKKVAQATMLSDLNQEHAISILSSLRGVMLGVRISDKIQGKLLVDFGVDATELKDVAKPLILKVMSNFGASLDEANEWVATVDGKRITFAGDLTPDGMRRLFSLVSLDASMTGSGPAEPTKKEPTKDEIAAATRRYYRSVTKYLTDLQKARSTRSLAQVTLWANNYSRKISHLPTRNVDPDMVAYGQNVAAGLLQAVACVQGAYSEASQRIAQIVPDAQIKVGALPTWNTVNYGNEYYQREYAPFAVGNVDIGSAIRERNQISAEEYQKGISAAEQVVDSIQAASAKIKSEMEYRYHEPY